MKYKLGKEIEWCGKIYIVERVYQLTIEETDQKDLVHRNRVTLVEKDGTDQYDFAVSAEDYADA